MFSVEQLQNASREGANFVPMFGTNELPMKLWDANGRCIELSGTEKSYNHCL